MKPAYALILLLIPISYALDIGLSIERTFAADALYFSYNDTLPLKRFSTEIVNTGSLPYMAQARVDIMKNTTVFTAWSDRKRLMPGNNAFFALYWLPEESGNYTARLRIYYGGEMEESYINITASRGETRDIFKVTDYRVLDDYIDLRINSGIDAVIIPAGFQQGWLFAQKSGISRFLIPYSAPGLEKNEARFIIASKDGQYASAKTLVLEKKKDIPTAIQNFVLSALQAI